VFFQKVQIQTEGRINSINKKSAIFKKVTSIFDLDNYAKINQPLM
jgi:hypothetical protein